MNEYDKRPLEKRRKKENKSSFGLVAGKGDHFDDEHDEGKKAKTDSQTGDYEGIVRLVDGIVGNALAAKHTHGDDLTHDRTDKQPDEHRGHAESIDGKVPANADGRDDRSGQYERRPDGVKHMNRVDPRHGRVVDRGTVGVRIAARGDHRRPIDSHLPARKPQTVRCELVARCVVDRALPVVCE